MGARSMAALIGHWVSSWGAGKVLAAGEAPIVRVAVTNGNSTNLGYFGPLALVGHVPDVGDDDAFAGDGEAVAVDVGAVPA